MKKRNILYMAIISIMIATNSSFTFAMASDIEAHWANKDIVYLIEKGYIQGYNDGTFKPNKNVTRAEFFKMVNNVCNFTEISEVSFVDVKKEEWYYDEIGKALTAGYVKGYEDGTIRPNRPITREEASKIIVMVAGLEQQLEEIELDFADGQEIGDWAKEYVKAMKYQGYMQGYEDGTFRPKRQITRAESAKILADISRSTQENLIEEPNVKEYLVQIGSYSSLETANEEAWKLVLSGFENTFIIKDDKYYVMAGRFSTEEEAQIFKTILSSKGFEALITIKDFKESNLIKPTEPIKEITRYDEFVKLVDELPNSKDIREIVATDKVKVEKLRNLYDNLTQEEIGYIPKEKINKFKEVESKIESLKTPIVSNSKASIAQAQAWAIKKGAHKRFIDVAPFYWEYGRITGINPEILYAQGAKETNFGRYTGQVKPEMNNWAGIKILEPIGDSTYDHQIFPTPEDGVRYKC